MGQGSQVVEGVSLLVDVGREGAVSDSCSYGDGLCLRVEHHGVESGERNLGRGAVGDGVEGVPTAEGAEFGGRLHHLLVFFDGLGSEQVVGVVGEVAGPIGAVGGWPRRRWPNGSAEAKGAKSVLVRNAPEVFKNCLLSIKYPERGLYPNGLRESGETRMR